MRFEVFTIAPQSYFIAVHCLLSNFRPEHVIIVELQQNTVKAEMHHTLVKRRKMKTFAQLTCIYTISNWTRFIYNAIWGVLSFPCKTIIAVKNILIIQMSTI